MRFHTKLASRIILLALAVASAAFHPRQVNSQRYADLVLRNGAVYTVAASRTWAEAVAVSRGRIVYVGSEKGVEPWVGPRTTVIDLQGKMLLPGFHDSHTHPVLSGIDLGECYLNEAASEQQVLDTIKQFAERNPARSWIRGGGWQLPIFENGNPHKSLLDRIVPAKPVYLMAADGHSAWVNSRALAVAGITASTADPPNGRIERDPKTGEPTGTLREAAMSLVAMHLPAYGLKDYVLGLRRALKIANRFGITSLQDASGDEENILKAYAELDRTGELTARVVVAMSFDPGKYWTSELQRLLKMRKRYQAKRLRAISAKIFVDGVIEARTAALLEPYEGQGDYRGEPNIEAEDLESIVGSLDRHGFQVHIHAIGDRATRMALNAFLAARLKNGRGDSRHHISHLQLVAPVDYPRFRQLGVVANFQPLWAYPDPYIKRLTEPVLGPERSARLYPIGSLARAGVVIACGSDWSVTSMNPLEAIQVAITRRGLDEGPGPAWLDRELVDLPTVIAGYTINGAYVNFQERETGSIEVGKAADLIVLDRNLFDIPPNEIHRAKVLLTLLDGKEVYRDTAYLKKPRGAAQRSKATATSGTSQ